MNITLQNPSGEILDYAFHADPTDKSRIVLIGHGVTGNKDRPWAEGLATALAAEGVNALRFSFAGNGSSEGDFRECTVTKEVGDLGAVITAVEAAGYREIVYAGHSMGGAVGVLRTSEDKRINRLISLAGMVHTAKFAEVEFGEETPGQGCMWDDPDCPLSAAFIDDMKAIDSVLPKAGQISVPWLLVHGDADDVVPIEESREIFAAANDPRKLVELPGVGHVFADEGLGPMIEVVADWLS